jgi:hypothetical protein
VKCNELDDDIPIGGVRRTIHLHEHRDAIPSVYGDYGKTQMVNKPNSLPADKSESASLNADTIVGIANDSWSGT